MNDHHMALLLQKQFDMEVIIEKPPDSISYYDKKKSKNENRDRSGKSLTDPSWELIDPTPNIHVLFVQFNEKYFWNKLLAVTVSWSKRMTSCAGICSYQGRGGICKITLSEPLLKLRPRKDLIETLLHEMIHALLFVTNNNRDRDGHGPEFHKHMYRINNEVGTNITVYHDFHDEVRLYKQHWWRCDGPCQHRKPFFGVVRRAVNRAPGPYDRWWAEHKQTCGGIFQKVREPEKNKKAKPKETETNKSSDMTKYFPVLKKTKSNKNVQTLNDYKNKTSTGTMNKNGTVVLNPKTISKNKENVPVQVTGFKSSKDLAIVDSFPKEDSTELKVSKSQTPDKDIDYSVVRNHWLNKFVNNNSNNNGTINNNKSKKIDSKRKSLPDSDFADKNIKRKSRKSSVLPVSIGGTVLCPICNKSVSESDLNNHLDQCLENDNKLNDEFQTNNDFENNKQTKNDIKMINCLVCNVKIIEKDLNAHLDICLQKDKPKISVSDPDKNNKCDKSDALVHCEICDNFIDSEDFSNHAADCLNKCYDEIEKKFNLNASELELDNFVSCLVCNKSILKSVLNEHLEECMGTVFDDKMEEEQEKDNDMEQVKKYNCPFCLQPFTEIEMNDHLDDCLISEPEENISK